MTPRAKLPKVKARLADEIDAGLGAHKIRLLSSGWGSDLENKVILMCPRGHAWLGSVGLVAKGLRGCAECSSSCSEEEAMLTFILRHIFRSAFPTARKPIVFDQDLSTHSLLLAMVVEYQDCHRFVYIPSFHEHYDEYATRVNRENHITRLHVPHGLDFQGVIRHLVTGLQALEIPLAQVDWVALEAEFIAADTTVAAKSPFASAHQSVGRPLSPVWRWLTDEPSSHAKASSRCFYCGDIIRHNRGNSLVKDHLLTKCASFQAFRAAMPTEQQPSWMLDKTEDQIMQEKAKTKKNRDRKREEKGLRRPGGRKWLLDEELLLLAAWKAMAADWDSWSFPEKVYGEYIRRLLELKAEKTGEPQSKETFLPFDAKTSTSGGLDVCNPLFSPRNQNALGHKMRQMKMSYTFVAKWIADSGKDSASWFKLPPERQAELLNTCKVIREPCYHVMAEIDKRTSAAAQARKSTSAKRVRELSIELVAVPKQPKLGPKRIPYM